MKEENASEGMKSRNAIEWQEMNVGVTAKAKMVDENTNIARETRTFSFDKYSEAVNAEWMMKIKREIKIEKVRQLALFV